MLKHTPEDENYDRERAEVLLKEIDKDEHAQKWIEAKWAACMSEAGA